VTYNDNNASSYVGNLFGGGNAAGVSGTTLVNLTNGKVTTGIYGGCNAKGTVGEDITVNVTAGQVGTSEAHANIHGGGYGSATATSGNIDVNIGASGTPNTGTAVIYGDVYGGSALGNVNSDTNDYTHVNLYAGTIYGDAYGGGLGDASNAALVNGNVMVTQEGVAFVRDTKNDNTGNPVVTAGRIFGCNNLNGSPQGTVLVLVTKTTPVSGSHTKSVYDSNGNITTNNYEMAAVYGGGNLAAYNPSDATANGQYTTSHTATSKPVQVVIDGCQDVSIEYVYGGGNAAPTPATDVVILGAYEIGYAFGGGNGKDKYTLDGTTWNDNPGADVGLKPLETGGTPYSGDNTKQTYGTGESLVTITGGTIHSAFGGSNTKGNVLASGTVSLNESQTPGSCPLMIDEVYGGGNEAYMAGNAQIELGCISYLKEIYGGAKMADLGGNIVLTITSGRFDRVFGGNNISGCINGSITVNIEETGCHPIVIGQLYGGGNQAGYSVYGYKEVIEDNKTVWKPRESSNDSGTGPTTPYNAPVVNVKSFTSIGDVFGGGFGATAVMVGNPTVNIDEILGDNNNGNIANNSYSYDTDANTGHFDTNGNFKGWTIDFYDNPDDATEVTQVQVPAHDKGQIGAINRVFGGGNAAEVIGNTNVNIGTLQTVTYQGVPTEITVIGADIRDNVYGGGNAADVTGKTNVKIGR
jgi:hypothetical protein